MKTSKTLIMASALATAVVWVALPASRSTAEPGYPCPPCTYDISRQELTGTLDPDYSAHPFPFTGMTLTLVDGSDNVLDTITDLPPSFQYGSTVLDQVIDTDVTSGVAKAQLRVDGRRQQPGLPDDHRRPLRPSGLRTPRPRGRPARPGARSRP